MVRLVRRFLGGEFYDEYGDEIGEKELVKCKLTSCNWKT